MIAKKISILKSIFILIIITFSTPVKAHEDVYKPINKSTLFGVGGVGLYDSYLSPLKYNGTTISILHDRVSPSFFLKDKLIIQQQFLFQSAISSNPVGTANYFYGNISYNLNSFYDFFKNNSMRILGGGGLDLSLGGLYNNRNSNNPVSIKTSTNLHLSVMGIYNWKRFTFRWQMSTPFIGVLFSPKYGQSYYEIFSLGNSSGVVKLASLYNQYSLTNYFTVDIHARKHTFRIGYLGNYYITNVNSLNTNILSHQFVLGLATETLYFGGTRARNNRHIQSSYY